MTKKTSPGQLKEKDDAIRRGFEKLTNSKPSNEDIEKLSSRQLKTFYKAGKEKRVGIRAKIIIVILAVMLPAAVYGSYRALNSDKIQNNPQEGTEEIKDASQTSTSVAPDSTSSPTTPSSNANNNSSNAVGGQGNNSNPNSQSTSAPAPAPSAKINNWNVYIY